MIHDVSSVMIHDVSYILAQTYLSHFVMTIKPGSRDHTKVGPIQVGLWHGKLKCGDWANITALNGRLQISVSDVGTASKQRTKVVNCSLAPLLNKMAFLSPTFLPRPAQHTRAAVTTRRAPRAAVRVGDKAEDAAPVGDRLLVRVAKNEKETASGLLLATNDMERPRVGVVVAVPQKEGWNYIVEDKFEVGMHVMWRHDYVAETVQDGDERIVSVRCGNLSARW